MNSSKTLNPGHSALKGFLFAIPFLVLNFIVVLRLEPFYSFLGSFPVIRNSPFLPLILLLLFPVGVFIAVKPVFNGGKRRVYLVNLGVAVIMAVMFVILFGALGEEFYRCGILKIPNCD